MQDYHSCNALFSTVAQVCQIFFGSFSAAYKEKVNFVPQKTKLFSKGFENMTFYKVTN